MKPYLTCLLILYCLSIAYPALSDDAPVATQPVATPEKRSVPAPFWHEFCPEQFCDAEWHKSGWFKSYEINNYWANRRVEFYNAADTCKYANDVAMCYYQLRQDESRKNQQYAQRLADVENMQLQQIQNNLQQTTQDIQNMYKPTTHCTTNVIGGTGFTNCTEY